MDVTKWTDKQVEKYINDFYGGVTSPSVLPVWLYDETRERLFSGVVSAFGTKISDLGDESKELLKHFEYNIAVFSGAKTHQQAADVAALLYPGGTKVPFAEFRDGAAKVFDEYNVRWLETEFRVANNSALMARQWLEIKESADVFPFLKYVTIGDDRVRDDHAELNDVVAPVDSDFWARYYPPNDWNCRCGVEQLTANEAADLGVTSPDALSTMPEPDVLFDGNVGIDKIIFDPRHPYYLVADKYQFLRLNNFNLPTPPKP